MEQITAKITAFISALLILIFSVPMQNVHIEMTDKDITTESEYIEFKVTNLTGMIIHYGARSYTLEKQVGDDWQEIYYSNGEIDAISYSLLPFGTSDVKMNLIGKFGHKLESGTYRLTKDYYAVGDASASVIFTVREA